MVIGFYDYRRKVFHNLMRDCAKSVQIKQLTTQENPLDRLRSHLNQSIIAALDHVRHAFEGRMCGAVLSAEDPISINR